MIGRAELDQAAATAQNASAELGEILVRLDRVAHTLAGEPATAMAALFFARRHVANAIKKLQDTADILYQDGDDHV